VTNDTPATVTDVGLGGPTTYSVKQALSYQKDGLSGTVRYRASQNTVWKGEVAWENLSRDNAALWGLDDSIARTTLRVGVNYRMTNRMLLRGDAAYQKVSASEGGRDNTYPDSSATLRGILTWTPAAWFNTLLSGAVVQEERSNMAAPFTGERKTDRSRVLASMTFLAGKKTAVTPSYAFFQNKDTQPIAYTNALGAITVEGGVPYADTAQVASIAVTHAVSDVMTVAADLGRSWSRGSWQNAGTVPGSSGIAEISNMHVIETIIGCDMHLQYTRPLGTDFRYQYRKLDNVVDNSQDGSNQILMATLTYSW
jgi:hypothetical protein